MFGALGKTADRRKLVDRLYAATVARARTPVFFTKLGVPDTIDGRFDLLALHAWIVLEQLRERQLNGLSQGFIDTIFVGFDEGLRDLGAGDMGMGRRIKKLADAFYGRLHAYNGTEGLPALTEAVRRNLYRGGGDEEGARTVARYVENARAHAGRSDIAGGEVDFGPLP